MTWLSPPHLMLPEENGPGAITVPSKITLKSGLKLYYESFGEGLPVVCIPGWCYTTAIFEHNLPELGKQYRAISYDPRSHGRSVVSAEGNNYRQHGKDLRELLDVLEIGECILLGWSLGVYTIYSYVEQFGVERIKGVIAVDESPKIIKSSEGEWGEGLADEVDSVVNMARTNYLAFFREYMAEGFVECSDEAMLDRFTQAAASLSPDMAADLLADAAQQDYSQTAKKVAQAMPVLNIIREDWAPEALKWIAENQPSAITKVLGKHLMLYEFANDFNACVMDFLADISAS